MNIFSVTSIWLNEELAGIVTTRDIIFQCLTDMVSMVIKTEAKQATRLCKVTETQPSGNKGDLKKQT